MVACWPRHQSCILYPSENKYANLLQPSPVFHSIFDIFITENLHLGILLLILYWLKTIWIAYLVICNSAKKWYVMLISINWLCPFFNLRPCETRMNQGLYMLFIGMKNIHDVQNPIGILCLLANPGLTWSYCSCWFALYTAALLVIKNKSISLRWELNFIFM